MKFVSFNSRSGDFVGLATSRDAQALRMVLGPGGESEDKPRNEHRHSEQWMFVMEGTGRATVGKTKKATRTVRLKPGSLLLIEKGEMHRIANTGRRRLVTLNFYIPPAYDKRGHPKEPT
ncbi:MAG: cupin domain-containing protein [Pirellulales bacterium]